MTNALVSLADIKGWGVRFEWYEALAIVQTLSLSIGRSANATGPARLELGNIFVSPSGDVTAAAGPQQSATAIPRVAQILSEILPDFHRRITFHSVLVAAGSDPPVYASLEELSLALAPFERPDRGEIVQALYRRAWKVGAPLSADARALDVLVPDEARPETATHESVADWADESASKGRRRRQAIRVVQALAVVAVVATIAGLGLWMVRKSGGGPGASDTSQASSSAAAPETPPTDNVVESTATSVKPSVPARSVPPTRSGQASIPATAVGTTSASASDQGSSGNSAHSAGNESFGIPSLQESPPPREPAGAGTQTYSAKDLDVVPPATEHPQQIWQQTTNALFKTPMTLTIEIVVNERGAVESVKAMQLPDDLNEAMALTMSLSVVKTWHFRPALKNASPVKYRHLVSVTVR